MDTSTTSTSPDDDGIDEQRARKLGVRVGLSMVMLVFVVFWTWALFFASKEAVNRIGDQTWSDRAELICQQAREDRVDLADFRQIREGGPELIMQRAAIVDESTDILSRMVDDLVAVLPTDPKGQEIVPRWAADYRIYLQDRRDFADQLRTSGENLPFYESIDSGIPISERIETFAGDNEMPACAPPRDLSV